MRKTIYLYLLLLPMWVVSEENMSWGITKQQYETAEGKNKLNDIGTKVSKKRWRLVVTAPKEWHSGIRKYLTKNGTSQLNIFFKDSLYESISILAEKKGRLAGVSVQHNAVEEDTQFNNINKQIVIEKPDIEVELDKPDISGIDLMTDDLTKEAVAAVSLGSPSIKKAEQPKPSAEQKQVVKPVAKPVPVKPVKVIKPKAEPSVEQKQVVKPVAKSVPVKPVKVIKPKTEASSELKQVAKSDVKPPPVKPKENTKTISKPVKVASVDRRSLISSNAKSEKEARDYLRLTYARNERVVHKITKLSSLMEEDDIYVKDGVMMVKRKLFNQYRYYWLNINLDLNVPQIIKLSKSHYRLTGELGADSIKQTGQLQPKTAPPNIVELVLTNESEREKLKRKYAGNKRIKLNLEPGQLRKNDYIYLQGETAVVKRGIGQGVYQFYWLSGKLDLSQLKSFPKNGFYRVSADIKQS